MQNIQKSQVLQLKDLITYQEGQAVSRSPAQNPAVSLTLSAFEKGEERSARESGGDAMVTVPDGAGRVTIGGGEVRLPKAKAMSCPPGRPTRSAARSGSRCC